MNKPRSFFVAVLLAGIAAAQSQPTAILSASNAISGAGLGTAVAISGSTVASGGATFVNGRIQGVVYVFTKASSAPWTDMTESAELVLSNGSVGGTVGISGDGNTIVSIGPGAVEVFVKPAEGWKGTISPSASLVQAPPQKSWIILGDLSSVAINSKGDTIVAGAFDAGIQGHFSEGKAVAGIPEQGAAYVWSVPDGGWKGSVLQTATLTAKGSVAYDHFGWSVGIFANTLVIGAPANAPGLSSNPGVAYLFTRPASGSWHDRSTFQSKFAASDGNANDAFGYSVSIGNNSSVIAIGSRRGCGSSPGEAYVFARPPHWWSATMTETATLTPSDSSGGCFGSGLDEEQGEILVGASNSRNGAGASYLFKAAANGWASASQPASMVGGSSSGQFGASVSMGGRTTAVGAPSATINGVQGGAVYLFSE